jgi:hypothetical protein
MRKVLVYHSLDDLPESYRALFDDDHSDADFFASLAWYQNLVSNSLNKQYRLRLYGLEQDGVARLLLPMCVRADPDASLKSGKLLAASNYYTSLFRPIHHSSSEQLQENLAELLRFMLAERPRWSSIDFHPMALDSLEYLALEQACHTAGMALQRYFCFGNWYLTLTGRSYCEYFDSLPSRLKNTLQKKIRQSEKRKDLSIRLLQTAGELDLAMADYAQVYQSSWKQAEAHPLFIQGLMRTCARQGSLRLGIAYVQGQAVAAQLWIVHGQVASIYKLAYDDRYAALSIGSILTAHMMQHVIEIDHVSEVDYLTGDDAYKQDWMSARRERWGIVAFNLATLSGSLAAGWHLGRSHMKAAINAGRVVVEKALALAGVAVKKK